MKTKKEIKNAISKLEENNKTIKKLINDTNPKFKNFVEVIFSLQIAKNDLVIKWLSWVLNGDTNGEN